MIKSYKIKLIKGKMKLIRSVNGDVNYLSKVIHINEFSPHPNPETTKLKIATIDGFKIAVSIDTPVGDYIYFPVMSQINPDLLSYLNLFREGTLNRNHEQTGFFEPDGRVKAIRLKGVPSEGFIMDLKDFSDWILSSVAIELPTPDVGTEFDTVEHNGKQFWVSKKYIIPIKEKPVRTNLGNHRNKKIKKFNRMIPDQFRFHYDTVLIKKEPWAIKPDDIIHISSKWHGCVDKDTIINTDKGDITIGEIVNNKLNVNIKAYDIENNKIVYVPIDQYYTIPNDGDWYEITLEDGRTIQITGNNPVWLPDLNCYRKVEDLNINDVLFLGNMQKLKIVAIKKIPKRDRYDLTVGTTKNFFANGILIHNTSVIASRVLCKTPRTRSEKLLSKIYNLIKGRKHIYDTSDYIAEYDYVYSSRSVIKNANINPGKKHDFYGVDVWKYAFDYLKPHLIKGMTIYAEIVGFLPNGQYIQKKYDYGCRQPRHPDDYRQGTNYKVLVYRITLTNEDGIVHEFSPREVQIWCKNNELTPVTEFYYGKAKDLYPDLDETNHWNENFIERLADDKNFYMEMLSPDCHNKVPHEGIVIKVDDMKSRAWKLKCFSFLDNSQKMLDKGIANIEDAQSQITEDDYGTE